VGPDGALWFTERLADKIGRLTTAGLFTEFPLPPFALGARRLTIPIGRFRRRWREALTRAQRREQ
jgi:streptogramin lyase